jgi:hypothetical protein
MTSRLHSLLVTAVSVAAQTPPEPKFQAITLDDKVQIGYGVAVADVDGDKAPDILLADKKQVAWYRNPGAPKSADPASWQKHILAEKLTEKDNVYIAAQDIDGDGKCEVAVGGEWNPGDTEKSGAVFYLIPPVDRTQRWESVKFPSVEPTTHRLKWMQMADTTWRLIVLPLHGRGNKNGEGEAVKVVLYQRPADPRDEWKTETIETGMHMTHNFTGPHRDWPLLIAGKEGTFSFVRDAAGKWERQGPMSPASKVPAGEVRVGLSRTRATIEPMHGNQLAVYPEGAGRIVLTDQLVDGHALAVDDILGHDAPHGNPEVIVGWRGNPEKPRPVGIKLFTQLDTKSEQWRESLIDDNGMACEDLAVADLNSDGKLDIVASGRSTHNLKLYLNETLSPSN